MKTFLRSVIYIILSVSLFVFSSEAYSQWQPTNGPFSGEVHSVIKNNGAIIVGADKIYKSVNNGSTWDVSNNGISSSVTQIFSLAYISGNLVAGTNEGTYYSSNNGDSWSLCSGTSSYAILSIVAKGSNLFMTTSNGGVFKSTNNGVNWSAVNNGITHITYMRSIAVKGTDLYAATDGYGIFKSSNDGTSWSTVNTGLPGSFYSVSSLIVVGNNILAGTYGAGVYKSTNDGGSWSAVNNGISASSTIMGMGVNGTSAYASDFNGNLYKSTDYSNWNAVYPGNFSVTRFEAFYKDGSNFYVGSWGFYNGTNEQCYGLFVTTDDGATWKQKGVTDYTVSALDVSGTNILAGTYDNTGNSVRVPLFKTTETDSAWNFNMGNLIATNITAIKSSGAVAYFFDYRGYGSSVVYRSTNNGNSWTMTGTDVSYNRFNNFVFAGSLIYASDYSSYSLVNVSSDNGATWTEIHAGIPTSVIYAYSLVLKGTTLFLGTDNGVYKNTVGQNSWTAVSTGLTNLYVKSLIVSGNDIYAGTQGGGVFKSSNNGSSWTDVSTGIPLFTNFTCFGSSGSNIFAGTDNGVFMTSNGGTNWIPVNTGLADTNITAMTVSTNYLWVGTTAHGVWKRQLSQFIASVPPQPGPITGSTTVCQSSTNTYSITPVNGATSYTWTLPSGWSGTSSSTSITATAGTNGGVISVTANNGNGSSTPQTLNVTVNSVDISVTQNGMTLTSNANPATWIWINCSTNLPVPGQTAQSFTASVAGNYAVIVSQNGCSDTSSCYLADTSCYNSISSSDLPFNGLSVLLSLDTISNVSVGNSGASQSWDYSMLTQSYQKYAVYNLTSSTPYASLFPESNIYTYGPAQFYGSLYGSVPVGTSNNGYVFWKSDNTGFWATGFRPDGGLFAGKNVNISPNELIIGSPATFGSTFNNSSRWVLPIANNSSNADTFYTRNTVKYFIADACGSITTPYGFFPTVLREHEYTVTVDSVYIKFGSTTISAIEFKRDTMNNYIYIANSIGYPVCIVHADKNNTVRDVEYYSGIFSGIQNKKLTDNDFLLYPNPSSGKFTINNAQSNSNCNIFIYNSLGYLVLTKTASDQLINVDISGFSKGLYIIKIANGNQVLVKKLILQ